MKMYNNKKLPPFEEVKQENCILNHKRFFAGLREGFWVSVLHRLTGFGYWEWETAIVRIFPDNDPRKCKRGDWDDRECLIVVGDHREELVGKTEEEIMKWYEEHKHEKNSLETALDRMESLVKEVNDL